MGMNREPPNDVTELLGLGLKSILARRFILLARAKCMWPFKHYQHTTLYYVEKFPASGVSDSNVGFIVS